jgi:hypothetical protein
VAVVEAALSRFPWSDLPIRHHFSQGIYARELTIPAGTLLTGSRHKAVNFHIVSEGEITVWGDGVPPEVIEAPFAIVAHPGARRIGYAHRNTVWTTILADPDGCQDPEALLARWTEIPEISAELAAAALPEVLVRMLGASAVGTAGEPRALPPAGSATL